MKVERTDEITVDKMVAGMAALRVEKMVASRVAMSAELLV